MLKPGPDHPIEIEPASMRWRAKFSDHLIADSNDAVILREADYPPVVYFPREDVGMGFMGRTERSTHCPYKGDATYFTLTMDGQVAENVAWSYEQPYDDMEMIAGKIAFYADRVEVYAVDDALVNKHPEHEDVDAVVLHTDAGDGTSQRAHWPANAGTAEQSEQPEGGVR